MASGIKASLQLAAIGMFLAQAAHAVPVTYDFSVNGGSSGPLAGVTSSGSFTFDDSIVAAGVPSGAPGEVQVAQAGLLSSLSFTWNGITYNASTANTGSLSFVGGVLSAGFFGTSCGAGYCGIGFGASTPLEFFFSWRSAIPEFTVPASTSFAYEVASGEAYESRGTALPVRRAAVPEPATIGLLGLGLALLGTVRRRK